MKNFGIPTSHLNHLLEIHSYSAEKCQSIPPAKKHFESMPNMTRAVIDLKGYSTNY